MTLALLTFVSPLMLGGLAAIALPIAAHLFSRRTRLVITFPTIRLLAESTRRRLRLSALRRRLLLLLRCLALVALVLAFSRPVWSSAEDLAAARDGLTVVIVLDNSASSAQRSGGVAVIESLKVRAQRVLGELRPGIDRANVVTIAPSARSLLPNATDHPDALAAVLSGVSASEARGDLGGALDLAAQQARATFGSPRIVEVSDLQATQWTDLDSSARDTHGIPTRVLAAGADDATNLAVSAPTVFPARPWVGQRVQLGCVVSNFGAAARHAVVAAALDGNSLGSRGVNVPPWSSTPVMFDAVIPRAGEQRVQFDLAGDDAMPSDDAAHLIVATRPATRVLLVTDEALQPPSGAYFISRALAASADAPLRVQTIRAADVSVGTLGGADIAVVSGAGAMPAASARALAGFVAGGGGLIYFMDRDAALPALQAVNAEFPATERLRALSAATLKWNEDGWRIAIPSPGVVHALTTDLRMAGEALRPATFHAAVPLKASDPARQITYDDGTAALVWKAVGRGRVAVCNFGVVPDASDLATHGSFVALMYELCDQVGREVAVEPLLTVGQPLRFNLANTDAAATTTIGDAEIVGPDGRGLVQTSASGVQTDRAGFYRLKRGADTLAWAAVNADPRESDLRRIDPAAAQAKVASSSDQRDSSQSSRPFAASVRPRVTELWPVCLALAALMLLGEMALLAFWKT